MSSSWWIVTAVVAGLVIGSFLTVVVDRVPQGGSVVAPPSRCGSCGLRLGPLDLVPVVSWVALRGRCRQCRAPIGVEPIVIELATAALFVLMAVRFDDMTAAIPAYWILCAALVALTWIDLRTQRLPREITYTAIVLGYPALAVAALVLDEPERIWMAALGAVIALALIGGIYLASNAHYGKGAGFGFGDVILSPLLGLYLGWLNPGIVPVGLFFGFLIGAIVAIPLLLVGRGDRQTALPFGPFLALGTIVAIFVGQHFVDLVLAR
jgi:leader peptidase (prepilin peptidase)/N-methyltransferase